MKSLFSALAILFFAALIQLNAATVVGLKEDSLRLFPQEGSEAVGTLKPGSSVGVLQESGEWSLIEVSNGPKSIKGWVKKSSLGSPLGEQATSAPWQEPRNDDHRYVASLAINPITMFFPWIELQIGVALSPHLRLNIVPTLMTWAYGDNAFDGAVYGGTLSLSGFFDRWQGWYLEPGFVFMKPSRGGGYWAGGQLIGGYEHAWRSGLFINFGLGAGVGHFDDGSDNEDDWFDLDGTYPYPTWNVLLGYRF